jgi:hypothetical protein
MFKASVQPPGRATRPGSTLPRRRAAAARAPWRIASASAASRYAARPAAAPTRIAASFQAAITASGFGHEVAALSR